LRISAGGGERDNDARQQDLLHELLHFFNERLSSEVVFVSARREVRSNLRPR
jgi:hypothetical protein